MSWKRWACDALVTTLTLSLSMVRFRTPASLASFTRLIIASLVAALTFVDAELATTRASDVSAALVRWRWFWYLRSETSSRSWSTLRRLL